MKLGNLSSIYIKAWGFQSDHFSLWWDNQFVWLPFNKQFKGFSFYLGYINLAFNWRNNV